MDALTGLHYEVHEPTSRHPAYLLMMTIEGARFYDDAGRSYGFRSSGAWSENNRTTPSGVRIGSTQTSHLVRESARYQPRLPERLDELATSLFASGTIVDFDGAMQGFGGCYFTSDHLSVVLADPLGPDERPDAIIEILETWFGAPRGSLVVTTRPRPVTGS